MVSHSSVADSKRRIKSLAFGEAKPKISSSRFIYLEQDQSHLKPHRIVWYKVTRPSGPESMRLISVTVVDMLLLSITHYTVAIISTRAKEKKKKEEAVVVVVVVDEHKSPPALHLFPCRDVPGIVGLKQQNRSHLQI